MANEANETITDFLNRMGFGDDVVADDGTPLDAPAPDLFTLAQANARIPEARTRVLAVQAAWREMQAERAAYDRLRARQADATARKAQAALFAEARNRFQARIDHLQALGCTLKDVEMGLIDFPSRRNGQLVNLCWHLGEENIRFWHGMDEGYAARKPL